MSFLNPLTKVTDYQSMLNRICWFSILAGSLATWIVREHYPAIDILLGRIDMAVDIGPVKEFPVLGYLIPGLVIGVGFRTIRLHDRISDLCTIRERFDAEYILKPMAEKLGFSLDAQDLLKLRQNRNVLMGRVFYKYASSTSPKIDPHFIHEALDYWSWQWVVIEAVVIFVPTGILALLAKPGWVGAVILVCCLLALGTLRIFRLQSIRYARDQVGEILSEPAWAMAVKQEFDAVLG